MSQLKLINSSSCLWGRVEKYSHYSETCKCIMKFSIFVPFTVEVRKVPALFFLSGKTFNEDTFLSQGGAIPKANKLRMFLVAPDTSPRNCGIDGEANDEDIGEGASFYLDATEPKWRQHYNMYTYINEELTKIVIDNFEVDPNNLAISGFSMGGHGALTIALKNTNKYKSCSAFAPICNPSQSKLGRKAFTEYLGNDETKWAEYDATEILKKKGGLHDIPIYISQGGNDEYYNNNELLTDNLTKQVKEISMEEDSPPFNTVFSSEHDHTYWFVFSEIENHIDFHAKYLGLDKKQNGNS